MRVERALGKRSLYEFVKMAWHVVEPGTDFQDNWHIRVICEHLEAVTQGKIKRLLINIPPRCMKSLIVSVLWPAWVWMQDGKPKKGADGKPLLDHNNNVIWQKAPGAAFKWLFSSYAQALSTRDSVKMRRLIQDPWFQARWGHLFNLVDDQNVKTRFENNMMGYRIATSVNGATTGEGGDGIVIDDPNNVREAESDPIREGTLVWLDEVMSTRLNDPKTGVIVIIQQRTHDRDVSGHVLRKGGYVHLCLPMEYDEERQNEKKEDGSPNPWHVPETPLGFIDPRTDDGELLWETRFGYKEVADLAYALGPYAAAGQLQQRPTPRGGGMFKREKVTILDALPALAEGIKYKFCRSWDFAATDPADITNFADPDWTSGALCAIDSNVNPNFYIIDVDRFRKEPGERDLRVQEVAVLDGYSCPIYIEQEPGQSGKSQIVGFRNFLVGYQVNPPRPDPLPAIPGQPKKKPKESGIPSGSKVHRAEMLARAWEQGRVFIIRGAWNAEYLHEIETFPMSHKKDQVDSTSQAFNRLTEKPIGIAELMALKGLYGR